MPNIEVKEFINAPIQSVWNVISDVEGYPSIMDSVKKIEVIENLENHIVAKWEVELKGSLLRWTEREELYPSTYRIEFHQIDGDLECFDGYWQLHEFSPGITEAILMINFEIGIPMLKEMLDPVASRALKENSRKMLLSLGPSVDVEVGVEL